MQVFSRIQRVFSWLSRPEKYRNLFARKGEKIPTSMLLLSTLTQRERVNHLPHLTPEKAGQLYEAYLRGELAEVQMVWKQMEDFDSTLGTVLHARQSALAEMTWRIETDDDLTAGSDELAALAAKQKAYLNALLRGVDNLEEALVHLGMADFRGVAAVELTGDRQRQVWSVIEPWNLTKPVLHGPWLYNAMADTVCPHPEELDEERVIIREARALDLAAMFLVLSKVHALQGWDGFLDIYGLPSVFAELPASIPEDQALEFDLVVKRMVGDGRGTVPNGTKFQTVETTKDNAQAFEQRAKWCDEAIIKLGLGGLLTVETQAGSGTLAGNAHADSFERLCAASARSISRAVDTQYCRRVLRAKFGPHTPILVHFVFGPQETEDRAAIATMLATLATAGYRAEDTVASDLLGIEITSANMGDVQSTMYNVQSGNPPNVQNRAPETEHGEEAPLTEDELAAIQMLAKDGLNQEQIAQDAATAANALAEAVQGDGKVVANTENDGNHGDDDCDAKDPAHCPYHHPEQKEQKPGMTPGQVAEMTAFKKKRKATKAEIKQSIPEGGMTVEMDMPEIKEAILTRNAIGEMLSDKAVRASVLNGCPAAAHVEAVRRAPELVAQAKKVSEEPGKKANDKVEKITHVETTFTASDNGEYIAHFTVHHPKPNPQQPDKPAGPPKIYFLFLRK